MPTFDPNNAGPEACNLYGLANLVAETEEFQEIVNAANAEAALEKIVIGVAAMPDNAIRFTERELANELGYCQLYPTQGGKVQMPGTLDSRANMNGVFTMLIERYVADSDERNNFYLWFLDLHDRLESKICELSAPNGPREFPIVRNVAREEGPAFWGRDTEEEQGGRIFALSQIGWGGPLGLGGGGEEG